MRAKYEQMIEAGAEAHLLTFDTVAPWDELSYSLKFYRSVSVTVAPTSVDAERAFSTLSRLKSKFRKGLSVHLPDLVRISQSKTLESGSPLSQNFLKNFLPPGLLSVPVARGFWASAKEKKRERRKLSKRRTCQNCG